MDDLLHLVNSDRADELRIHVGKPPVIILAGEQHEVEGPPISPEDAQNLLRNIADTRQRRELRERGLVQFVYRFRHVTDFVVCARMENENVRIDIQ